MLVRVLRGKAFFYFLLGDIRMTAVLRLPAVKALVQLSRTTIYQKISEGEFPRPFKLGERAVAWLASDIEAWLAARVASSKTEG